LGAITVERAFLFTDIDSSTSMFEADPFRMQAAVARHDALTADAVTGAGGEVVKSTGDGALCAFPTVDAALAGAVALFRACAAEPWPTDEPLQLRAAVHHGSAIARDGDYFGPTLNRAARLEAAGHGGQLLVSADALASGSLPDGIGVVDLGEHRLRSLPDPIHVFQVVADGLTRAFPPLRSLTHQRDRLPPRRDRFVGRSAELDDVAVLLDTERLVTLVGPGGVGKTRLAVEAADRRVGAVDDVWFCDLRRAATGGVDRVVLAELGGSAVDDDPRATVAGLLGHGPSLVVVDNAEHVLDELAELLDDLLDRTPRAAFLVTSRVPLDLPGEVVRRVQPLGCADARDQGPRLFCERATGAVDDGAAVVELCRHLDGLPLAIELAARHARSLTPAEILGGLQERFDLLDQRVRGRTLWSTIEWSMQLLSPAEHSLFSALAVFGPGAAAAQIAQVVGMRETEVVRHLARLLDVSLLTADGHGQHTRVGMLESVHDYAVHLLALEPDRFEELRGRHCRAYVDLLTPLIETLHGPDEAVARHAYRRERPNLEVAARRAMDNDFDDLVDLALVVLPFEAEERNDEPRSWLVAAVEHPELEAHPRRARVLAGAASLVRHSSDHERAAALARAALDAAAGDVAAEAQALAVLAAVQTWMLPPAAAADTFARAQEKAIEAGELLEAVHHGAIRAATIARISPDSALQIAAELDELADHVGQPTVRGLVAFARALAYSRLDLDAAIHQMERAIALGIEGGNQAGIDRTMIDLAELRARRGGTLEEAMAAKLDGLGRMTPEGGVFPLWNAIRSCLPWLARCGLHREVVIIGAALEATPLRRSRSMHAQVEQSATELAAEVVRDARVEGSRLDVVGAQELVLAAGEQWLLRGPP
jgi:predicted ATPase/class 3 adenylate cyclase